MVRRIFQRSPPKQFNSFSTVGLDVNGAMARDVWGGQWLKLMGILYEGATTGLYGSEGRLIGGKSPEGIAARVRVQLEIERLLKIG